MEKLKWIASIFVTIDMTSVLLTHNFLLYTINNPNIIKSAALHLQYIFIFMQFHPTQQHVFVQTENLLKKSAKSYKYFNVR